MKRQEALRKRLKYYKWQCEFCKQKKQVTLSKMKKKYCSKVCQIKFAQAKKKFCTLCGKETHTSLNLCGKCRLKKPKRQYKCKVCDNLVKENKLYCSEECKKKAKETRISKIRERQVKERTKFCPICKTYKLFKTVTQKTCSRECSKSLVSGKNAYHWKGGHYIKPVGNKKYSEKDRLLMSEAYERDGRKCQLQNVGCWQKTPATRNYFEECKSEKPCLLVHHIISRLLMCKLMGLGKTRSVSEKWNLIAICWKCHGPLFRDVDVNIPIGDLLKLVIYLKFNNNGGMRKDFKLIREDILKRAFLSLPLL